VSAVVAASHLDRKHCGEDELENWEGGFKRAMAGSQEEKLEHAKPAKEEARCAPDGG
jgi:hypothetical protein